MSDDGVIPSGSNRALLNRSASEESPLPVVSGGVGGDSSLVLRVAGGVDGAARNDRGWGAAGLAWSRAAPRYTVMLPLTSPSTKAQRAVWV